MSCNSVWYRNVRISFEYTWYYIITIARCICDTFILRHGFWYSKATYSIHEPYHFCTHRVSDRLTLSFVDRQSARRPHYNIRPLSNVECHRTNLSFIAYRMETRDELFILKDRHFFSIVLYGTEKIKIKNHSRFPNTSVNPLHNAT